MAPRSNRQWENNSPVEAKHPPPLRHGARRQDDHHGADRDADDKREPESLENLGAFQPEVGTLDFFLCCTPGDVVGEHVGKERLGEVNTETAEKEEA